MAGSISPAIQTLLREAGLPLARVERVVRDAVAEDLNDGPDITSVATISDKRRSTMDLVARTSGVIAGLAVAASVFDVVDSGVATTPHVADGDEVEAGTVLLTATGSTRSLLAAERTALNLLSHLSGIATTTRAWVRALEGTNARVRDTRKTLPGLRHLQKYAVRIGGGENHRMSLSDAALIKDNHVVAAGSVAGAFDMVRRRFPDAAIEVEVDSLDQLTDVLDAGATFVLLDNFSVEQLRQAVALTAGRATLEASGGLTLANAREVGATGVDYLAVGALTHTVTALDIAADLRAEEA